MTGEKSIQRELDLYYSHDPEFSSTSQNTAERDFNLKY